MCETNESVSENHFTSSYLLYHSKKVPPPHPTCTLHKQRTDTIMVQSAALNLQRPWLYPYKISTLSRGDDDAALLSIFLFKLHTHMRIQNILMAQDQSEFFSIAFNGVHS